MQGELSGEIQTAFWQNAVSAVTPFLRLRRLPRAFGDVYNTNSEQSEPRKHHSALKPPKCLKRTIKSPNATETIVFHFSNLLRTFKTSTNCNSGVVRVNPIRSGGNRSRSLLQTPWKILPCTKLHENENWNPTICELVITSNRFRNSVFVLTSHTSLPINQIRKIRFAVTKLCSHETVCYL